jgi:hypothetical protein
MNLRDLPNLSKLDKRIIESIDETPFQLLLDEFGDPAWPAVTRVCGAIGWNPSDYYDRHEVTLSLRAIQKKIAERAARRAKVKPATRSQSQPTEAQPA